MPDSDEFDKNEIARYERNFEIAMNTLLGANQESIKSVKDGKEENCDQRGSETQQKTAHQTL